MLKAGLFSDFKGANTLLFWGDEQGLAELRASIAALSSGRSSTITVGEVSIAKKKGHARLSELSHYRDRLFWACAPTVLADAEGLLAGLDQVPSGHHLIDITGLADQVIVSKCEYPADLRPRH